MTGTRGMARLRPLGGVLLTLGVVSGLGGLFTEDILAAKAPGQRVPAACNAPYNPAFSASDFRDGQGRPFEVDNPYFPLDPGTTYIYRGTVDGEPERSVVKVTNQTVTILGVRAVQVLDQVFTDLDGDGDLDLAEDTLDWYAQDKLGNVWYLGEDTKELDANGNVISTAGTWKAGVDGAKPGIVMEARPRVGDLYRQEFLKDVAEDMAQVVNLNRRVSVPYGSFDRVLQTEEWACHDPEAPREFKYYAREVGFIMGRARDRSSKTELVRVVEEDEEDD